MNENSDRRFEELVALNIEGISSSDEEYELWQTLKHRSEIRQDFFLIRNIHYLLKIHFDPTASETAFVNRVQSAFHKEQSNEKDLVSDAEKRPPKPWVFKNPCRYPGIKIAASILIVLGSVALFSHIFFSSANRIPEISESADVLDWRYKPATKSLEARMAKLEHRSAATPYYYSDSGNPILKNTKLMNAKISRMEKFW